MRSVRWHKDRRKQPTYLARVALQVSPTPDHSTNVGGEFDQFGITEIQHDLAIADAVARQVRLTVR